MKTFLLTLFVTISALGQPVIGPEVTSVPMDGVGNFTLAPQQDGFVVAWEQNGRIHVGHLDSALQLEGGALELPVSSAGRIASSPSVATNGTTALITWHEWLFGQPDVNVVAAVRTGALSLLSGPQKLDAATTPAIAAWGGSSYVVYSAGYQYRVTEALDVSVARGWFAAMSAAVSAGGNVATATDDQGSQLMCFHFGGWGSNGDCTPQLTYTFAVESGKVEVTYSLTVKVGTSVTLPTPIVAANGASFTALVRLPAQTDVVFFDDILRKRTTLPVTILADAAIAGNGGDVLTVWTGPQQLTGILTHGDGSVSKPFDISNGAIDLPHVVATGSNTFVVFYRISLGSNVWALAGRVIHLQPSKQRAIR